MVKNIDIAYHVILHNQIYAIVKDMFASDTSLLYVCKFSCG
jgi:hypothetical protein